MNLDDAVLKNGIFVLSEHLEGKNCRIKAEYDGTQISFSEAIDAMCQ